MRVLTIDTSTQRASVAAVHDGHVLASAERHRPTAHAELLFAMIDEVLGSAGWKSPASVQLIGVGKGPGSFTGVRVGMAAAKGLCAAWKVPLVGVGSLDAMGQKAQCVLGDAQPVIALLDAKKNEVFASCLGPQGAEWFAPIHLARTDVQPWIETLRPRFSEEPWVVGEVACALSLSNVRQLSDPECDLPSALPIAQLAEKLWSAHPIDQLELLEPLYVRPPDIHGVVSPSAWSAGA